MHCEINIVKNNISLKSQRNIKNQYIYAKSKCISHYSFFLEYPKHVLLAYFKTFRLVYISKQVKIALMILYCKQFLKKILTILPWKLNYYTVQIQCKYKTTHEDYEASTLY